MRKPMTEQVFMAHSGEARLTPGQIIFAKVDCILATDGFAGILRSVEEIGGTPVAIDRFVAVADHHVPANTAQAADTARAGRLLAEKFQMKHFYDVGRGGVCHHILPEIGMVHPGDLIIGGDSHTVTHGAFGAFATGLGGADAAVAVATGELWFMVPGSFKVILHGKKQPYVQGKDIILTLIGMLGVDGAVYKAIDFTGPALGELTIADRVTMSNMVVEMGAKAGIFEVDVVTEAYFADTHGYDIPAERRLRAGDDDQYERVISLDISSIEPVVAAPDLPSNTLAVRAARVVAIDQAVLGSCTNGRLEDMRIAAAILRGQRIDPRVRLIVVPGTQRMYRQMIDEGLVATFLEAGAIVGPPGCGPCCGVHMGMLGDGETCLSCTNRNFAGRMGSPKASVYLGNPAIVAASAIAGVITHPEEVASCNQ